MSDQRQNGQISRKTGALIALVFILGISALVLVARQSAKPEPGKDTELILPQGDPVLAWLNGETITQSQLSLAMEQWNTGSEIPITRLQALERLIQQRLLAHMGEDLGVDKNPETRNRLGFMRDLILAEDGVKTFLVDAVTETEIQTYYETERKIRAEQIQVKARQVVTPDAASAYEIIRRLDEGESFATLALAFSLDRASRESGGDLGYLNYDMLDPVLNDQIFSGKDGDRLEPFQTGQGWHVVEVLSRRKAPVPSLEERREAIIALLKAQKLEAQLKELRQNANLKIFED